MSVVFEIPRELALWALRRAVRRALTTLVPPVETPGLDPDLARVARLFDLAGQHRQPVAVLRLGYELDALAWQAPLPDGVQAADQWLAVGADPSGPVRHVRVRTYTPAHGTPDEAALVYVHGGGFAIGSLRTHDAVCRRLAAGAGITIQSLEYRLAPEHPFPAGLTDIVAAWSVLQRRWVQRSGDPTRIGIGGDSAGGHAAATVADEAAAPTLGIDVPMPGYCWMVYPGVQVADAVATMPTILPAGALLNGPMVARFTQLHVPDAADRDAPALNPLAQPHEVLAQHPPTWLQTVRFDPLLDQGRAYAERLAAAGVEVTHDHDPAMAHGYISMTGVSPRAAAALGRGIAALRRFAAA